MHGRRRPCAGAGAYDQDWRQQPHRHGVGRHRQVAGRAHRSELRRPDGRRSAGRRRQSAHRSFALDPGQEDRHHPRLGLCRGQEADRHFRRGSDLRRDASDQRAQAPLPALAYRRLRGQRPHHAVGRGGRCGHPRPGGHHRAPVRPGDHQFRLGDAAAAGAPGSALHRDRAQRRPRSGRAVEPVRRQQHHQCRQPRAGVGPAGHGHRHRQRDRRRRALGRQRPSAS